MNVPPKELFITPSENESDLEQDIEQQPALAEIPLQPTGRFHYEPLLLVFVALAAGIVVDRCAKVAPSVWVTTAIVAAIAWGVLLTRGRDRAGSLALLLLTASLGGIWHHATWFVVEPNEIGLVLDESIRPMAVRAIAVHSPRWVPAPPPSAMRIVPKGEESELLVRVIAIRERNVWRSASGLASLDVEGHLEGVRAGDTLEMMVLASRPMQPLNPGDFDYAAWQRSRGIYCMMRAVRPECITKIKSGWAWSFSRIMSNIRERGSHLVRAHIATRRGTLASAVLLGTREQLDPQRNEDFLLTGTIHVLSISGIHVSLLAGGFWTLLRLGILPRRAALWSAIVLTLLYAVLIDAQPPVMRAAVLVAAVCLAMLVGRRALSWNSLALAGILVLVLNPASLFLAGPQLSFLAVAVMILMTPLMTAEDRREPLQKLIDQSRAWPVRAAKRALRWLWQMWLVGAAIWITSLPIVWQQYGLISPVGLLLNLVIMLPTATAMYSGFALLLLAPISPLLGDYCGACCDGSLWLMELAIVWGKSLPASYFKTPPPPLWWTIASYLWPLPLLVLPRKLVPSWHTLGGIVFVWLLLGGCFALHLPERLQTRDMPLRCTFIAVGHGLSVLVEYPDGTTMLYDAGKVGAPVGAARAASSVMQSRGLVTLDRLVISHADADHFSGVPMLVSDHRARKIYTSPSMLAREEPAVRELREAIERSRTPTGHLAAGDQWTSGAAITRVLHPRADEVAERDNENSLVLAIEIGGRRILLTGDLEGRALEQLLAREALDADVVLAPHHGSPRSNPDGFASWCKPEVVVISGSRHPEDLPNIAEVTAAYEAHGSAVYHTQVDGSVTIEITPQGALQVSTFRQRTLPREASAAITPQ